MDQTRIAQLAAMLRGDNGMGGTARPTDMAYDKAPNVNDAQRKAVQDYYQNMGASNMSIQPGSATPPPVMPPQDVNAPVNPEVLNELMRRLGRSVPQNAAAGAVPYGSGQ